MEFQGDGFQFDERKTSGAVRAELSNYGFGCLGHSESKMCSTERNRDPQSSVHTLIDAVTLTLFTFFVTLLIWNGLVCLPVDLLMVSLPVEGKPHENQDHICLVRCCVPTAQKSVGHMVGDQ